MGGHSGVSQPPNEAIKALEDVLGNDSTREVVRLFLHDFPESIRRIGAAGREDQMRIVHGLKSSSLHMGATVLSDRLASLEEKLEAQGETLSPDDLQPAIGDFGAVSASLRAYAGPERL
jgi:HPt (histidine-containing phosphotransfer) domain-containing protein